MIGHSAFAKKYASEVEVALGMGNRYDPDYVGRFPWDTECMMAQASLGRLVFWVHIHGGCLSSTFALGSPPSPDAARGYTIFARIWLRPEKVALVERDAKVKIKAPPVAHVNSE